MSMLEHIRDLYAHLEWADALVWRELGGNQQFREDHAVLELLAHLHEVQHAFLDVWLVRPVQRRDPRATSGAAALCGWARTFYPQAADLLKRLDVGRLEEPCVLPWARHFGRAIGREPAESTLGETLTQVVLHSTHHRAQVSRRIRSLGGEPPLVDFIAWAWGGRPAPAWPAF